MTPYEIRLRHNLSRALNNLVIYDNEAFEATFIHLMRLLPFGDHCTKCCTRILNETKFDAPDAPVTEEHIDASSIWPYKRDQKGKCFYICPICGDRWTVGFYGGSENKVVYIAMNDVS